MENSASLATSAMGSKGKIVVACAALTLASYLVLTKYNGVEYLTERLKQRDEAIRLDQRCTQIRKKIEAMWQASQSIVHPINEAFVIKQFGIDFVIMQKKGESGDKGHIRTSSGNQIAPDLIEEVAPRVAKIQQ